MKTLIIIMSLLTTISAQALTFEATGESYYRPWMGGFDPEVEAELDADRKAGENPSCLGDPRRITSYVHASIRHPGRGFGVTYTATASYTCLSDNQ